MAAYKWFDIAARWHRSRQLYAPVSGASNTSATAASPPRAYTPCSAWPSVVAGIDDPVLGDARLGIVDPLVDQIPFRAIRADHLDHQIRSQPVTVLTARIRAFAEQQQVRFPEHALAHAQPQRREHDHAAPRPDPGMERPIEERQDRLVREGRPGQLLNVAVGEFDQAAAPIREPQVFLVAPRPLARQGVTEDGVQFVLRSGSGRCGSGHLRQAVDSNGDSSTRTRRPPINKA